MNVLDTLGLVASSFGQWQGVPAAKAGLRRNCATTAPSVTCAWNSRATGSSAPRASGSREHVGVIRGLIQGRVALGEWKAKLLRDPTRLMDAYLARAQAAS